MLRDYKRSLTLIAFVLLGYTAMVILNKRPITPVISAGLKTATVVEDASTAATHRTSEN